jgi:hypothetical protein
MKIKHLLNIVSTGCYIVAGLMIAHLLKQYGGSVGWQAGGIAFLTLMGAIFAHA